MGIDKSDIRYVIHYGLPKSIEGYYQETGRAGRDGFNSKCILFWSKNDFNMIDYFCSITNSNKQKEIIKKLANNIKKFIYSRECRRKFILNYFGEEYNNNNCKKCDVCIDNKNLEEQGINLIDFKEGMKQDFTKESKFVAQAVYECGERFGVNLYCMVLKGSRSSKVTKGYVFYIMYFI